MFAQALSYLAFVAVFVSAATSPALSASPSPTIIIDPPPPLCPLRNVTCCQNVGDVSQPAVDLALLKAGLKPKKEYNLVGYGNCRNQSTSTSVACLNELLCCQDNNHQGIVALTCRLLRPPPPGPTVTPL